MSYFSQLGLSHAGTGYAGGWRNGDVEDGGEVDSPRILCTGKIEQGGEVDWRIAPLQDMIDAAYEVEPPTRDDRVDEAAALYDNARYYEWLKAEREDYEEYMRDVEFWRTGC